MTTIRALPPEEWPRLAETGCDVVQRYRGAADHGCVLVSETETGEIVGTLWVTFSARLDGAWVHPEYRDGAVLRRLGRAAMTLASARGVADVFAPVTHEGLSAWMQQRLKAEPVTELVVPVVRHG